MPLTEAQEKQVIEFLADPAKALKIGDLVATAVGEGTTANTKAVEALAAKVDALIAAPKPGDKQDGDGKKTDKPDPVAEALDARLKPVLDELAAMKKEKQTQAETQARDALIAKTLGELKYSGLTKHKTFVRDLHARGVTKPEEVKAALEEFIADQKVLGVEIKPTGASPEGEGAKGAGGSGGGAVKPLAERIESIKRVSAASQAKPVGA